MKNKINQDSVSCHVYGLIKHCLVGIWLFGLISCEKQIEPADNSGVITLNIENTLFTENSSSKSSLEKVYFCEFPGNPPVEVPVSYYVRFFKPETDEVEYEFSGITDLSISFEIPLSVYDVEVSSYQGVRVPRKSKDMILYQKVFGVDFTTESEVSLGVIPVQTLVLIAKKNLKPGDRPKFKTEFDVMVSDLFEINEDYYGAFVAPEYQGEFPEFFNGEIEMIDASGKNNKVAEVWQRGKVVKYMNCPDAETGIQVGSGNFTELIDIIVN